MKTLSVIATVASFLLLGSTLLCGLWIRSHATDAAGIRFHVMLGMVTVGVTAGALLLQSFVAKSA